MCHYMETVFSCNHSTKHPAIFLCDSPSCNFIFEMPLVEEVPDHMFRSEHLGLTCALCYDAQLVAQAKMARENQELQREIEELREAMVEAAVSDTTPSSSSPSPPLPLRDPARIRRRQHGPSQTQERGSSSRERVAASRNISQPTSSSSVRGPSFKERQRQSQAQTGARPCRQLAPLSPLSILEEDTVATFTDANPYRPPTYKDGQRDSTDICNSGPCDKTVIQNSDGQKGLWCKKHSCQARDWDCLNDTCRTKLGNPNPKYCLQHTCSIAGCGAKVARRNDTLCSKHSFLRGR